MALVYRRVCAVVALVVAIALLVPAPARAVPTDNLGGRVMDFGSNGSSVFVTKLSGDRAFAVAVDSVGRDVVAAAYTVKGGSANTFGLLRFLPNGELDPSFGTTGRILVTPPMSTAIVVRDVLVAADDKIVVFGTNGSQMWLGRFTASGAVDTSFGSKGWRRLTAPAAAPYVVGDRFGIAQRPDGRFVVAFSATSEKDSTFAKSLPYMYGLTADGFNDASFGAGGAVGPIGLAEFCCQTVVVDVALRPDGGLLLGVFQYYSDLDSALIAFTPNGVRDTSFANAGFLEMGDRYRNEPFLRAFVVHPSGKITASVTSNGLMRWLPDGTIDASFATAGRTNSGGGSMLLADGEKVLATDTCCGANRTNAAGNLDPTFDGVGFNSFTGYPGHRVGGIALRPGGTVGQRRFVVVGSQADLLVFHFKGDGSRDTSFSGNGDVALDQSHYGSEFVATTMIGDGASGLFFGGTIDGVGAVARMLSNGKPDNSFGVGGVAYDPELSTVTSLVRGSAGAITALSRTNALRFTAAGVPDVVFNGGEPAPLPYELHAYGSDAAPATIRISGDRIYMAGQGYAAVLQPDGTLDETLGIYKTDMPAGERLVPRGDGYLKIAREVPPFEQECIVTIRAELAPGEPDPSYGNGGQIETSEVANWCRGGFDAEYTAAGLLLMSGNKIVRLLDSGDVDPSFTTIETEALQFVTQPDGAVVGLGEHDYFGRGVSRRYTPDGAVDVAWGNRGVIGVGMGLDRNFQPQFMVASGSRIYYGGLASDNAQWGNRLGVVTRDSTVTGGVPVMAVPSNTVVWEGQETAEVTMRFDRSPDVPVTFRYVLRAGTADVPEDAGPEWEELKEVWGPPARTTATAQFTVNNDTQSEPDEQLDIEVVSSDFTLVRPNRGTITIRDDDRRGSSRAVKSAPAFGAFDRGAFVAGGDVDGDGNDEVIVAPDAGGVPVVRVLDGATLAVKATFMAFDSSSRAGVRVAAADVDGDGRSEVVAVQGRDATPTVKVFKVDGETATEHVSFPAYADTMRSGVYVASADVDGDGRDEIVTAPGAGGAPYVRVWAIPNRNQRALVAGFWAYAPGFAGGLSVAGFDHNGDGRDEIATAAGAGGGPHVQVFAVANRTATPVTGFMAYDPNFTGGVLIAGGRLSGYAAEELVTTAGPGGGPHVAISQFPPGTRRVPHEFMAYEPTFTGGARVAVADTDGDGRSELVTVPGPGRRADVVVRKVTL